MMRKTHRAFAGAFWLGSTLAVNAVAWRSGHELPVHPVAVGLGLPVAAAFSAGRSLTPGRRFGISPDLDHLWAPGPPARDYDWRRHRGFTHRIWFASFLSIFCALLPALWLTQRVNDPLALSFLLPLLCAPMNGWWSHLVGDMIYGRLKVGWWSPRLGRFWTWNVGLGWRTGGLSETGQDREGARFFIRDPAAKVCLIVSAALVVLHLACFT